MVDLSIAMLNYQRVFIKAGWEMPILELGEPLQRAMSAM